MIDIHYVVDTNVLSKLTAAQRASTLMQTSCCIPSEVLREAEALPDIGHLQALDYPVTARVLEQVRTVMLSVHPGDYKLVDLYHQQGNADPLLVATALDAMADAAESLWPDDWRTVTDDKGVTSKAAEFGVKTVTTEQFVALLD